MVGWLAKWFVVEIYVGDLFVFAIKQNYIFDCGYERETEKFR